MLSNRELSFVDDYLAGLPDMLQDFGINLRRKRGYTACKLSSTRNWCHILEADIGSKLCSQKNGGEACTWKLFARFSDKQPPNPPWKKIEQSQNKRQAGLLSGMDVWGLTYEDLYLLNADAKLRFLQGLVLDLVTAFAYSKQRYA